MTEHEFKTFWQKQYPEAYPIKHELKWVYPKRWLRMHSLPESKRYADTEAEYQIILRRQNQLLDALIGEGTFIFSSFLQYTEDLSNIHYRQLPDFTAFQKTWTIDLHQERPEEHESDQPIDIFVKREKWQSGGKDELLRAIADDVVRVMFICPSKNCIVAPYDGGVDVIVDSTDRRDALKQKYKDWLSATESGL
ncbi:MAG: hypothetical protein AAF206_20905 [Bacteroidota bacterium]